MRHVDDFQLFLASELDIAKIDFLKLISGYFRHLSWIGLGPIQIVGPMTPHSYQMRMSVT